MELEANISQIPEGDRPDHGREFTPSKYRERGWQSSKKARDGKHWSGPKWTFFELKKAYSRDIELKEIIRVNISAGGNVTLQEGSHVVAALSFFYLTNC